ncbi:hypothetical protein, partial [[Pantoea] beijingensis]|uniref:hypothetical protein n=1 Tax=[Pantoea] beijingensis TaxID=1324864 RepID=UPI0019D4C890
ELFRAVIVILRAAGLLAARVHPGHIVGYGAMLPGIYAFAAALQHELFRAVIIILRAAGLLTAMGMIPCTLCHSVCFVLFGKA